MLLAVLLLLGCGATLRAQEASKDSLFRLLEAERAEQYEQFGIEYRLVKGHARFLHNDTYLLCDSASWNVNSHFIEAFGNVQLIQDKTMLKSEQMLYWIDENRALFRGPLVQLFDKDGNTLRTERLSYNTKDSVAVFESGGSLKDKDGNVIESRNGTYDAKEGLFTFEGNVELYMDSLEIKTQTLRYFNDQERAHFGKNTYVWRDEGFLRADAGWYDRPTRVVQFADHVFLFNDSYDAWADELYYYQQNGAADLLRNAQVLDTTNKSIYLGDHLKYLPATDSLSQRGLLTGDPAIVYYGENENHEVDTLFARADTFFVYTVPRWQIPGNEVEEAQKRKEDILYDALSVKRQEEAEAREKERIEKLREVGKLPPEWVERQKQAEADSLARLDSLARIDSLARMAPPEVPEEVLPEDTQPEADTVGVAVPPLDSLAAPRDTEPVRDTTPIRYVHAWYNVRMFRSDLQAACDSVAFSEVDSIARLFGRPVLWNEIRNQLTAEEMQLLMQDGNFKRGSMLTDAWIISQQDSVHFNQIKSTEMLGYFNENKLYRFDALGGVSAIFYMVDEDVVTTINVKESKSLTAAMKDGNAQRLLYLESIKSDAYPVGELEASKQRLKGFEWRAGERPVSRRAITGRELRTSERASYVDLIRPLYRETNKYFENYMYELIEQINARKRAELEQRQREQDSILRVKDSLARMVAAEMPEPVRNDVDSVGVAADTTFVAVDTTVVVAPPVVTERDSSQVVASPETVEQSHQLTRAEKRALRRAERKARREARRAARLARRLERRSKKNAD